MGEDKPTGEVLPRVLGIMLVVGLGAVMLSKFDTKPPPVASEAERARVDKIIAEAASNSSPWSYHRSPDALRCKDVVTATTTSTNAVDFRFPYEGGSSLNIALRQRAQDGFSVILNISKGQMLCHSYDGCAVAVKFDGGRPERFTAQPPSDGSIDSIFIMSATRFLRRLKTAKVAIIELEFYQAGSQQFTFNTAGLHWPPRSTD